MQINYFDQADSRTIQIFGDLDAASAINLDKAIEQAVAQQKKKLLVDCTNLNYISSAGVGVFMSYIKEFEERNITLVLFGLSPKVRNVFQIVGLDTLLTIAATEQEARKKL
ncbi:MAG: STAS domain-containing protein [Microscillaceae bacterium]|nr:STAS domain-containing protein [Microscillaceae bacterium]MDW8460360.1 STAS domain-containing protein [Cytophagales bacterium]